MTHKFLMAFFGLALFFTACKEAQPDFTFDYNFNRGAEAWTAGFADYTDEQGNLELAGEIAPLPLEINPSLKVTGYKVQGHNRSADLFMFLKRKVSGLTPNTAYEVRLDIQVASNAPTGAVGIGGAPGEAVYFKAGATQKEPVAAKNTAGAFVMNIDKGNQATGGADMKVIGNAANGTDKERYVTLSHSTNQLTVRTDDKGECWLIVGTDSGFEGKTVLYYQSINAEFTAL